MYVRVSFRVTVSISCSSNTVPARCRVMQNQQSAVGLYSSARAVCTLPAVPRSTQPSTLRGTVNEYQLSGWAITHSHGSARVL